MWLEEALPAFEELLELERLEGTAAAQERLETYRQAYLGLRELGAGLAPLADSRLAARASGGFTPGRSAAPRGFTPGYTSGAPSGRTAPEGHQRLAGGNTPGVGGEAADGGESPGSPAGRIDNTPGGPEGAASRSDATMAASRSKGVWVLWMLRRGLGELAFQDLQQEPGAMTGTDRLREAIRRRIGGDFEEFFDFWVYGTDLPAYRLDAATGRPLARATGGGYTVTLRLANDGTGVFPAPAVVRTEEGARHEFRVSVPGGETRDVTYPVLTRPVAAAIDPEGELLQSGPQATGEWRAVRLRRWWIF